MKKFYLSLLSILFLSSMCFAQTAETDLQEKTNKLEGQMRSIQKTNVALSNDVGSIENNLDRLATEINTLQSDLTSYTDGTKANTDNVVLLKAKIKKIKKYYKLMLVYTTGLFLLLLIYLTIANNSLKNKLKKQALEATDETKALLAQQKTAFDKKLEVLAASIPKPKAEKVTKEEKPAKPKK